MTIEMTVEERWDRLDELLREKDALVAEAMELTARDERLKSALRHYGGLAIQVGGDIPCPECGGPIIGEDPRECRDCGARWQRVSV